MDRFNALGRGAQIMLVAGVLLLISTFFNWQSFDIGIAEVGQNAWHGFWGVVMGLLTLALIAWLVSRVAGIALPLPFSNALIGGALAVLIFVFALLKNLTDDYTSFWAWIGLVLAAVIAVGAWLEVQSAGGMEKLRSEIPSMPASSPEAPRPAAPEAPRPAAPEAPRPAAPEAPAPEAAAPPQAETAASDTEESTGRET